MWWTFASRCARAASGQTIITLPRNSRRLMRPLPPLQRIEKPRETSSSQHTSHRFAVLQRTDAGEGRFGSWPCQNAGAGRTRRTPFFFGAMSSPALANPLGNCGGRWNKIPLRERPFGVFTHPGSRTAVLAATGYPQIYVRSTADSWRDHSAHDDFLLSARRRHRSSRLIERRAPAPDSGGQHFEHSDACERGQLKTMKGYIGT